MKTKVRTLWIWLKARWDNPYGHPIRLLHNYECPRCKRVWYNQYGGKNPETIAFYCSICCKDFWIPESTWTAQNCALARSAGITLKIKSQELGYLAMLEQRQ